MLLRVIVFFFAIISIFRRFALSNFQVARYCQTDTCRTLDLYLLTSLRVSANACSRNSLFKSSQVLYSQFASISQYLIELYSSNTQTKLSRQYCCDKKLRTSSLTRLIMAFNTSSTSPLVNPVFLRTISINSALPIMFFCQTNE